MRDWKYYLMKRGKDFSFFWEELLSERERNLLFVIGLGFDPRMCLGLEAILKAGGSGRRDCLLIEYEEGSSPPSNTLANLAVQNRQTLNELLSGKGSVTLYNLQMWSDDRQRRIASRRANDIFDNLTRLAGFIEITDIVVDISSMPTSIYLSIIAKLLFLIDRAREETDVGFRNVPNLHVVVAENVNLDERIQQQGIDEKATYLQGFSGELDLESTANVPKIWLPILGEGKETNLRRIYEYLGRPNEICPVLPFPSVNPRRSDSLLLLEYRELFFDEFQIEPRDIIHASEQNPFEAYRQIYRAVIQYNKALAVLGGCKAFISPLSSKLLSFGSFLAAYEIRQSSELKQAGCRVGIVNVESQGYQILGIEKTSQTELFTLWLAGECYES